MSYPLEVKNLVKDYGTVRAVDGVSFALKPGEIYGLLGPNGAGKTSIISSIVTLTRPTSGDVFVFGFDVTKESRKAKALTGWVAQEIINPGFFTVEEILQFHSGYYGLLHNRSRVEELIHRMHLWEHRKKRVKQLSGGMKRRLMIAKALVHSPPLLLLDEPTAGVDVELRSSLWELVKDLRHEGVSILLTTHYLEEAEQLCDRVGILHQGQLLRTGETSDLIREFTQRKIRLRLKEAIRRDWHHPQLISREGSELVFHVPYTVGIGSLLAELELSSHHLDDVIIQEGSLEDVFRLVLEGQR